VHGTSLNENRLGNGAPIILGIKQYEKPKSEAKTAARGIGRSTDCLANGRRGRDAGLQQEAALEWGVVQEAVPRLIEMAELLLSILNGTGESFEQFSKLAKRATADFWRIKRQNSAASGSCSS